MNRPLILLRLLCLVSAIQITASQIGGAQTLQTLVIVTNIIKLDPKLDALIAPDARLETIKDNYYTNVEGPTWVGRGKTGYLLFSDINLNLIQKFDPGCERNFPCPVAKGKTSVYMEHAGYTQADVDSGRTTVLDHGGPVGLQVDKQGRILMADYGEHAIVRLEKNGTRTMLATNYGGKRFSCPNKLTIKSDRAIYFTDVATTCIKGGDQSAERELNYHGFFLLKDGKVTLLGKDPQGAAPHGITMSPDEKVLYIGIGKKILAYDIKPDDTVANERVFIDLSNEQGGVDGINMDSRGNLWFTGPGGIWIVSPQGQHLGTIASPAVQGVRFANCAFGDPDRKMLYIVGGKNLWRIRLKVAGLRPKKS